MSGKLLLSVMDRDNVVDETAGSLIFDYKELLSMKQRTFFWANVYGAPGQEGMIAKGGDMVDAMNEDPSIATLWKGRILIGIEYEESESPKLGVEEMSIQPPKDPETEEPIPGAQSLVEESKQYMDPVKYRLMYEFNSVINIPEHEGKYNLQLRIGEHEWTSEGGDSRAVGYNYNRWNQKPKEDVIFEAPYRTVEDMEDIFLYLCPDKKSLGSVFGGGSSKPGAPIAYAKLKAADYQDKNPALEWIELQPEPIEDEIDSPELAGIVGFRLTIIRDDDHKLVGDPKEKDNPKERGQENWNKKLRRRPESAFIRCYLFQCKGLPAADDDGSSDPRVFVYNTIDADSNSDRMKS